jgi:RNA polymerase sigma-70 factor (ECF subfamily)
MITSEIFTELWPKLRRFALSKTNDTQLAEDLVMDVITKILEKRSQLPDDLNIEAYAITSIRNNYINHSKKYSKMEFNSEENGQTEIEDKESIGSDKFIYSGDFEKYYMTLGESCKEILTLFALGNSYKEICQIVDAKIGTVMSRMARCREKLFVCIDGEANA